MPITENSEGKFIPECDDCGFTPKNSPYDSKSKAENALRAAKRFGNCDCEDPEDGSKNSSGEGKGSDGGNDGGRNSANDGADNNNSDGFASMIPKIDSTMVIIAIVVIAAIIWFTSGESTTTEVTDDGSENVETEETTSSGVASAADML